MIIFWSSVLAACSQTLNLYFMSCFLDFSLAHFFDWTWVYSMCCSLGFLGARFSVAHLFDWNRNLQVLFIANTSEAICESVLLQFRDEFLRKFKTKCSCSDSSSKKLSNPSWFWFFSSLSCLWFSSAACPRVVPSQWWCTARRRRHRFADALGPLDFWIQWLILSSKLSPSIRSSSFGLSCLAYAMPGQWLVACAATLLNEKAVPSSRCHGRLIETKLSRTLRHVTRWGRQVGAQWDYFQTFKTVTKRSDFQTCAPRLWLPKLSSHGCPCVLVLLVNKASWVHSKVFLNLNP